MISIESPFPVVVTAKGTEARNDEPWLAAARRGESWALERLYQSYRDPIYRLCFRLLGRAEDAEDALQMTFVQAFAGLPGFRGGSTVHTWLYRIAVRQVADLRRRPRYTPHEGGVSLDQEVAAPDTIAAIPERIVVARALARLKPEFRDVLVLRFWEGLEGEEIARVLEISLPAAKMRLMRARAAFRRVYDPGRPE